MASEIDSCHPMEDKASVAVDVSRPTDNIKVAVRQRKLYVDRELRDNHAVPLWKIVDGSQLQPIDNSLKPYVFDHVYGWDSQTDDIYRDLVSPVVKDAMIGINGTVFMYGQTASGKTYTMTGTRDCDGIVQLAARDIYNYINTEHAANANGGSNNTAFLVRVSYIEIYTEVVRDLLASSKKEPAKEPVKILENTNGQVIIKGVTEEKVKDADDIIKLLSTGEENRHFGATNMNEKSSRSHTIFRIIIESTAQIELDESSEEGVASGPGLTRVSVFNLVDLAGSENAHLTNATGQRQTEASSINKSLLSLSQVIKQLSKGDKVVTYRDSKLTRLLRNSLGGNSRTVIICCMNSFAMSETVSTLNFATNAKRVKNRPEINEDRSSESMLQLQMKEIRELKKKLQEMAGPDNDLVHLENQELQTKLLEKEREQHEQNARIEKLLRYVSFSRPIDLPTDNDELVLKQKVKRRETWCPGKSVVPSNSVSLSRRQFNQFRSKSTAVCNSDVNDEDYVTSTASKFSNGGGLMEVMEEDEENTEYNQRMTDQFENEICAIDASFCVPVTDSGCTTECTVGIGTVDPSSSDMADDNDDDEITINHHREVAYDSKMEEMKELVVELMRSKDELVGRLEAKDEVIKELQEQLSDQQKSPAALSDVMTQSDVDVSAMSFDATTQTLPVAAVVEQTVDINVEPQLQKALNDNASLQSSKDELVLMAEKLFNDIDIYKKNLEEMEQQRCELSDSNSKLKNDYDRLEAKYAALEYEFTQLEQEHSSLREFTHYEKDLREQSFDDRLQSTHQDLIDRIQLLEKELDDTNDALKLEQQRYSAERSGPGDSSLSSVSQQLEAANLVAQLESCRVQIIELETANRSSEESKSKLQQKLDKEISNAIDIQDELQSVQDELFNLKISFEQKDSLLFQHETQLHAKESQLQEMQGELSSARQHIELLSDKIAAQEGDTGAADFDQLMQELKQLKRLLDESTAREAALEQAHQAVKDELRSAEAVISEFEIEKNRLLHELAALEAKAEEENEQNTGQHLKVLEIQDSKTTDNEQEMCIKMNEGVNVNGNVTANQHSVEEGMNQSCLLASSDTVQKDNQDMTNFVSATISSLSNEHEMGHVVTVLQDNDVDLVRELEAAKAKIVELQDELHVLNSELDIKKAELVEFISRKLEEETMNVQFKESAERELQVKLNEVLASSSLLQNELDRLKADVAKELDEGSSVGSQTVEDDSCHGAGGSNKIIVKAAVETDCMNGFGQPSDRNVQELFKRNETLQVELKAAQDRLLVESNRDLDIQRQRSQAEAVVRDMQEAMTRSNSENSVIIDGLMKKVSELSAQLQRSTCDLQLAQHQLTLSIGEVSELKAQLHSAQSVSWMDSSVAASNKMERDPDKLLEHIKKLMQSRDLAQQQCQNLQQKIKDSEECVRKYPTIELQRDAAQKQVNELRQQLQEANEQLSRMRTTCSNSYSETKSMKLHVDSVEHKLHMLESKLQESTDEVKRLQEAYSLQSDQLVHLKTEHAVCSQNKHHDEAVLLAKLDTQSVELERAISERRASELALKEELEKLRLDSQHILDKKMNELQQQSEIILEQKLSEQYAESERILAMMREEQRVEAELILQEKLEQQRAQSEFYHIQKQENLQQEFNCLLTQKLEQQKEQFEKDFESRLVEQCNDSEHRLVEKLEQQRVESERMLAEKLITQQEEFELELADKLERLKEETQYTFAQKMEELRRDAELVLAKRLMEQKEESDRFLQESLKAQKLEALQELENKLFEERTEYERACRDASDAECKFEERLELERRTSEQTLADRLEEERQKQKCITEEKMRELRLECKQVFEKQLAEQNQESQFAFEARMNELRQESERVLLDKLDEWQKESQNVLAAKLEEQRQVAEQDLEAKLAEQREEAARVLHLKEEELHQDSEQNLRECKRVLEEKFETQRREEILSIQQQTEAMLAAMKADMMEKQEKRVEEYKRGLEAKYNHKDFKDVSCNSSLALVEEKTFELETAAATTRNDASALEGELREKDAEIMSIKEKFSNIVDDLKIKTELYEGLIKQVHALKDADIMQKSKIVDLESELRKHEDDAADIESIITCKETEIGQLETKIEQLQQQLVATSETGSNRFIETEHLKEELLSASEKVAAAEKRLTDAEAEILRLSSIVNSKSIEVEQLKEKLGEVSSQVKSLQIVKLEPGTNLLDCSTASLKNEALETVTAKINLLEKEIVAKDNNLIAVKANLELTECKLAVLQSDALQSNAEVALLKTGITDLELQLTECRETIAACNSNAAVLEVKVSEASSERDAVGQLYSTLHLQYDNLLITMKNQEEDLLKKNKIIDELREEMQTLKNTIAGNDSTITECKKAVDILELEVSKLREQNELYQAEMWEGEKKETELEEVKNHVVSLEANNEMTTRELRLMEAKALQLSDTLKEERMLHEHELIKRTDAFSSLKSEYEHLRIQVQSLELNNDSNERLLVISASYDEAKAIISNLEKELAKKTAEYDKCEHDYEEIVGKLTDLQYEFAAQQEEMDNLKAELAKVKGSTSNNNSQIDLRRIRQERETLKKQLQAVQQEVDKLKSHNIELSENYEKLKIFERKVSECEERYRRKTEELKKCEQDYEELEKKLESLQEFYGNLEDERDSLKVDLAKAMSSASAGSSNGPATVNNSGLQADLQRIRRERNMLKAQLEKSKRDCDEFSIAVSKGDERTKSLEQQISQLEQQKRELEERIGSVDFAEKQKLIQETRLARQRAQEFETNMFKDNNRFLDLTRKLKDDNNKNLTSLHARDHEISKLLHKISKLEAELATLRSGMMSTSSTSTVPTLSENVRPGSTSMAPTPLSSSGAGVCGDLIIAQLKAENVRLKREYAKNDSVSKQRDREQEMHRQIDQLRRELRTALDNMQLLDETLERHREHVRKCPSLTADYSAVFSKTGATTKSPNKAPLRDISNNDEFLVRDSAEGAIPSTVNYL